MKRVVKIVLLIGFLVAVFIFSSPWLYYWAAPTVDYFSDLETKFYVYDVKNQTKKLVFSQKGLSDRVDPAYISDEDNKIYFAQHHELIYIIPEVKINTHRSAAIFTSVDLGSKNMKKMRRFDYTYDSTMVPWIYYPFINGNLLILKTEDNHTKFIKEEGNRRGTIYDFTPAYDFNHDFILPLSKNEFLILRPQRTPGKFAVTVHRIKHGKMSVLVQEEGIGGLLHFSRKNNLVGFTILKCNKFAMRKGEKSQGCKLQYYAYNVTNGKIMRDATIPLADGRHLWLFHVRDKDNIIFRDGNRLLSFNVISKKFTPYYTLPSLFFKEGLRNAITYGSGDGVIAMEVEKKLPREIEKHSMAGTYGYSQAYDLYALDVEKKKIIPLEKNMWGGYPSVAWNDEGDKMLYVVRN